MRFRVFQRTLSQDEEVTCPLVPLASPQLGGKTWVFRFLQDVLRPHRPQGEPHGTSQGPVSCGGNAKWPLETESSNYVRKGSGTLIRLGIHSQKVTLGNPVCLSQASL